MLFSVFRVVDVDADVDANRKAENNKINNETSKSQIMRHLHALNYLFCIDDIVSLCGVIEGDATYETDR